MIGIGGGATLDALRATGLGSIEVVELEAGVVEALPLLYRGREDPLADPRVRVRINDGRNELLLARAEGRSWDVIASQPSHPWLMGAANLFTEEFFALVRDNLSEGGTFGAWINGTHTDTESLLAIMTSFERVFPGGLLLSAASTANPTKSLLLLGGRSPVVWDLARMRERLAEPALAAALALHDVRRVEDLLARAEAPLAALAALDPDAANTDDNAFVETRLSRRFDWADVDFGKIEERLPRNAPVLPPLRGELDAAALLDSVAAAAGPDGTPVYRRKLDRLLAQLGAAVEPILRETLDAELTLRAGEPADPAVSRLQSLARHHPGRAEPLRALGRHWARRGGDLAAAAAAFEEAWRRSGESSDAYDAARAWHSLDREASWGWRDRIPPAESDRFPRIAVYDAERALAQGADRGALERHERAVRAYRDTREGRKYARIDRVLADLATALGRDREARAYADADRRRRAARAGELVRLAETALGEGRLSDAQGALDGAAGLLPGDFAVLRLQVQLARARRDAPATAAALGEIQHWARTLERGVAAENRVRAELGLPLRPPRPAPTGLVAGQPPGG
ncbi:MAG: hypothetical protein O7G30_03015 [Proteobacteria bacterium]|nr:hypothetical protein [Pseudomonadota bacterium]